LFAKTSSLAKIIDEVIDSPSPRLIVAAK